MNRQELPAMFPGVVNGITPLEVFADVVDECDFPETSFFIRRLRVIEWMPMGGPDIVSWCVMCVEVDHQDRKTGKMLYAMRNDSSTVITAGTEEEAETRMRELAIHYVEWALKHGEASREAPRSEPPQLLPMNKWLTKGFGWDKNLADELMRKARMSTAPATDSKAVRDG